jgi:hypothetical protein
MGAATLGLFDQGLIDTKTADAWADEVWCEPMEEETDGEEEQQSTKPQ